jgi:hypothetical protein
VIRGLRFTLLIPLAALLGCGANPTLSPAPSPYLNLTGNWEAIGTGLISNPPTILTSPIADFTGALQSTNGTVTGTLRAFDVNFLNPCVPLTQDLPATGTLSAGGNLVLTVPISGGAATITATLVSNLQSFTQGSWQITGGTCAMPSTPMAITQFAPLTGTYSGTLTNPINSASSSTITAVLTQSATPDSDGRFPLTGTVSSTGTCSGTLPLAPEVVSGNGIFSTSGGFLAPNAVLEGPFLPTATSIQATVEIYNLNCSYPILRGTLTRQ